MLIKTEGLRGRTFATRAEANLALFEPQPRRVRRAALRRTGSDRTSEPETPPTCPDQLISPSRATGEPQSAPSRCHWAR